MTAAAARRNVMRETIQCPCCKMPFKIISQQHMAICTRIPVPKELLKEYRENESLTVKEMARNYKTTDGFVKRRLTWAGAAKGEFKERSEKLFSARSQNGMWKRPIRAKKREYTKAKLPAHKRKCSHCEMIVEKWIEYCLYCLRELAGMYYNVHNGRLERSNREIVRHMLRKGPDQSIRKRNGKWETPQDLVFTPQQAEILRE